MVISHGFSSGIENGTNRFSETLIKLSYKIAEYPAEWSPSTLYKDCYSKVTGQVNENSM